MSCLIYFINICSVDKHLQNIITNAFNSDYLNNYNFYTKFYAKQSKRRIDDSKIFLYINM